MWQELLLASRRQPVEKGETVTPPDTQQQHDDGEHSRSNDDDVRTNSKTDSHEEKAKKQVEEAALAALRDVLLTWKAEQPRSVSNQQQPPSFPTELQQQRLSMPPQQRLSKHQQQQLWLPHPQQQQQHQLALHQQQLLPGRHRQQQQQQNRCGSATSSTSSVAVDSISCVTKGVDETYAATVALVSDGDYTRGGGGAAAAPAPTAPTAAALPAVGSTATASAATKVVGSFARAGGQDVGTSVMQEQHRQGKEEPQQCVTDPQEHFIASLQQLLRQLQEQQKKQRLQSQMSNSSSSCMDCEDSLQTVMSANAESRVSLLRGDAAGIRHTTTGTVGAAENSENISNFAGGGNTTSSNNNSNSSTSTVVVVPAPKCGGDPPAAVGREVLQQLLSTSTPLSYHETYAYVHSAVRRQQQQQQELVTSKQKSSEFTGTVEVQRFHGDQWTSKMNRKNWLSETAAAASYAAGYDWHRQKERGNRCTSSNSSSHVNPAWLLLGSPSPRYFPKLPREAAGNRWQPHTKKERAKCSTLALTEDEQLLQEWLDHVHGVYISRFDDTDEYRDDCDPGYRILDIPEAEYIHDWHRLKRNPIGLLGGRAAYTKRPCRPASIRGASSSFTSNSRFVVQGLSRPPTPKASSMCSGFPSHDSNGGRSFPEEPVGNISTNSRSRLTATGSAEDGEFRSCSEEVGIGRRVLAGSGPLAPTQTATGGEETAATGGSFSLHTASGGAECEYYEEEASLRSVASHSGSPCFGVSDAGARALVPSAATQKNITISVTGAKRQGSPSSLLFFEQLSGRISPDWGEGGGSSSGGGVDCGGSCGPSAGSNWPPPVECSLGQRSLCSNSSNSKGESSCFLQRRSSSSSSSSLKRRNNIDEEVKDERSTRQNSLLTIGSTTTKNTSNTERDSGGGNVFEYVRISPTGGDAPAPAAAAADGEHSTKGGVSVEDELADCKVQLAPPSLRCSSSLLSYSTTRSPPPPPPPPLSSPPVNTTTPAASASGGNCTIFCVPCLSQQQQDKQQRCGYEEQDLDTPPCASIDSEVREYTKEMRRAAAWRECYCGGDVALYRQKQEKTRYTIEGCCCCSSNCCGRKANKTPEYDGTGVLSARGTPTMSADGPSRSDTFAIEKTSPSSGQRSGVRVAVPLHASSGDAFYPVRVADSHVYPFPGQQQQQHQDPQQRTKYWQDEPHLWPQDEITRRDPECDTHNVGSPFSRGVSAGAGVNVYRGSPIPSQQQSQYLPQRSHPNNMFLQHTPSSDPYGVCRHSNSSTSSASTNGASSNPQETLRYNAYLTAAGGGRGGGNPLQQRRHSTCVSSQSTNRNNSDMNNNTRITHPQPMMLSTVAMRPQQTKTLGEDSRFSGPTHQHQRDAGRSCCSCACGCSSCCISKRIHVNGKCRIRPSNSVVFDCFYLKIVFERGKTGFEDHRELVLPAGTLFAGRYLVQREVGRAAFSRCLRCIDTAIKQPVCLKIIKNEKEYMDQSLDEVKTLRYLQANGDPDLFHYVKLLDCFYHREHLVLVTELLSHNLYHFSSSLKRMKLPSFWTLGRVQRVARELLLALHFTHKLHVIHCDLKPENVLLRPSFLTDLASYKDLAGRHPIANIRRLLRQVSGDVVPTAQTATVSYTSPASPRLINTTGQAQGGGGLMAAVRRKPPSHCMSSMEEVQKEPSLASLAAAGAGAVATPVVATPVASDSCGSRHRTTATAPAQTIGAGELHAENSFISRQGDRLGEHEAMTSAGRSGFESGLMKTAYTDASNRSSMQQQQGFCGHDTSKKEIFADNRDTALTKEKGTIRPEERTENTCAHNRNVLPCGQCVCVDAEQQRFLPNETGVNMLLQQQQECCYERPKKQLYLQQQQQATQQEQHHEEGDELLLVQRQNPLTQGQQQQQPNTKGQSTAAPFSPKIDRLIEAHSGLSQREREGGDASNHIREIEKKPILAPDVAAGAAPASATPVLPSPSSAQTWNSGEGGSSKCLYTSQAPPAGGVSRSQSLRQSLSAQQDRASSTALFNNARMCADNRPSISRRSLRDFAAAAAATAAAESLSVKLIDFGNSCRASDALITYVQSRSYRAPEVLLELPYGSKIDIWSLGCVLFELFTGVVLFMNEGVPSLLARIVGIIGPLPWYMVNCSPKKHTYFDADGYLYSVLHSSSPFPASAPSALSATAGGCTASGIDDVSEPAAPTTVDDPVTSGDDEVHALGTAASGAVATKAGTMTHWEKGEQEQQEDRHSRSHLQAPVLGKTGVSDENGREVRLRSNSSSMDHTDRNCQCNSQSCMSGTYSGAGHPQQSQQPQQRCSGGALGKGSSHKPQTSGATTNTTTGGTYSSGVVAGGRDKRIYERASQDANESEEGLGSPIAGTLEAHDSEHKQAPIIEGEAAARAGQRRVEGEARSSIVCQEWPCHQQECTAAATGAGSRVPPEVMANSIKHVQERGRILRFMLPKQSSLRQRLRVDDNLFVDFLECMLKIDPVERWSAERLLQHPFLQKGLYADGL